MQTIRHIVEYNPMALVWPAIVFLVTFGAGWVGRRILLRALRAWIERTKSRPAMILRESLLGPILIWSAILGIHLALQSSELPAKATGFSAKLLLVLWIVSLTLMCMRLAGNLVRYYGSEVSGV